MVIGLAAMLLFYGRLWIRKQVDLLPLLKVCGGNPEGGADLKRAGHLSVIGRLQLVEGETLPSSFIVM